MKSLTAKLKHENARELLNNLKNLTGSAEIEYGDSVLSVAMEANPVSFDIWKKEDANMCEALRKLMQPEMDAEINAAVNAAVDAAKLTSAKQLVMQIKNVAQNLNTTINEACRISGISYENFLESQKLIEDSVQK